MIVPRFRIVQTDEHLIIIVKVPYVKISNAEVYVEKFKFTFFLKPYLLNLNFKSELREEDPSSAVYDHNTYETTFKLRKKNVGEHFEDTDMINSLLNKKKDKGEKKKTFKIEVLGGQDFNTEEGKTEEIKEDKTSELNKEPHDVYSYGFNRGFTKFFDHLEEELLELCELDPDRSNLLERRELKLISEEQKFDVDHYLADKFENPEIERIAKEKLRIYGGTLRAENENEFVESKDQSKFEEEEWNIINKLPRKEYLIEQGSEALLLQLVDILFAFLYEYRSMEGDFTSESGWTINKLSATLSCFTEETDVRSVIISSMRRSLIYPLYRSTELSYKILEDLVQYLRAGKLPLLKVFLKIKSIFERSEPRYLLNTLYIDDFCLYLQTIDQKKYEELANQIAALKIEKKDISLDLEELEKEALEVIEDEKNNPRGEEDDEEEEEEEEDEEEEIPVKKEEAPQEKKKGLIEVVGETKNDDGESESELEKLE